MNLTITVDDDVLRRARIRALEQGTSVNAVLREFLESYAGADGERRARDSLLPWPWLPPTSSPLVSP